MKKGPAATGPGKENCGNSAPIVSESDTSAKNTPMFYFYAFFSIAKILTLYKADMVQDAEHTLKSDRSKEDMG